MSAPGTDISPSASDVAIAVVSYNARAHLRACLATALEEGSRQIVVVDNASSDGSVDMVREEFRGVVVHANQDNRGYGAAANQAVAACSSRYVLVLNADTLLTPKAPTALAEYLDAHPQVAVAGPRLVNPDGSLQPSCHAFPTAATILVELTPLARLAHALRPVPGLGVLHPPAGPHDRAQRVDWVKGAALAIRREVFEQVGGFDESFFMYWEDADFCYRVARAGYRRMYVPLATVRHAAGQAAAREPALAIRAFHNSAYRMYWKHASTLGRLVSPVVRGGLSVRHVATGLHAVADLFDATAAVVALEALARGVEVMPLSAYCQAAADPAEHASQPRSPHGSLVLGFGAVQPESIEDGMRALAASLDSARRTTAT